MAAQLTSTNGAGAAPAHRVDVARHQLLAGAVLAEDEHAAVRRRGHRDLIAQARHRQALADHRVLRVHLGAQRQVLGLQPALAERVADDEHGLVERQRLLDEVERAHLDGAHRGLDAAVAGDDHHLGVAVPLAHAGQRRQTVHARQPDVEHDHVVGLAAEPIETGFPAVHRVHGVALVAQHAAKGAADAGFVVDDEDGRGHRLRPSPRRSARQLDDEPRAARHVVGHVDRPAVFGDDAAHDGEAQTAAALLGRVIRQEQFVALGRRNAGAVVGDDDPQQVVAPCRARSRSRWCPSALIASTALSTRLSTTRRICSGSTDTRGSPAP